MTQQDLEQNKLSKKALLSKFTMQLWSGRKQDKEVNRTVDKINDAHNAGNFTKKLIDDPLFAKLGYIIRQAYVYHQKMTIPWLYKGVGILPMKLYIEYTKRLREYSEELQKAKRDFQEQLPSIIEKEKTSGRLGKLFNPSDYPEFNDLVSKFNIDIKFAPVPESGHFIVDLQNEDMLRLKSEFDDFEKQVKKEAASDLWNRLYEVVKHMAEKLSDPKASFKDTLVSNIAEICSILPSLNIMDDENLNEMVRHVEKYLVNCDPQTLRTDKGNRLLVAKDAKIILKTMEGYI
jgi:hypothetical protein